MLSINTLLENKDSLDVLAETLSHSDIEFLVDLLTAKHDEVHYAAFLALRNRSEMFADVYPHWDTFVAMMNHKNSYHRSIGIMLIAENVRHDKDKKLDSIINEYQSHCRDEKFITCRQTIQSIGKWIKLRTDLFAVITQGLMNIDIESFKDSQKKLILIDILKVLATINKIEERKEIVSYIGDAFGGGYLDKKAKKELEALFNA